MLAALLRVQPVAVDAHPWQKLTAANQLIKLVSPRVQKGFTYGPYGNYAIMPCGPTDIH